MTNFIFWCLKRLAILTVKYTKHPEGKFQMGASVVVNGKYYPFIFESNMWNECPACDADIDKE